jgi:hypothetical protein
MRKQTTFLPLLLFFIFATTISSVLAGPAYDQLKDAAPDFDGGTVQKGNPVPPPAAAAGGTQGNPTAIASLAQDTRQPAPPETKPAEKEKPKPPKPPTPVKDFFSEIKTPLFLGVVGGFIGFAIFGPIGILLGAALLISFFALAHA